MNKLTKTAKTLDTVFKIIHILFTVVAVAAAVFFGIILIGYLCKWDPDTIGTGYAILELGSVELQLSDAFAPDKWLILLQTAIMLGLSFICLMIGRSSVKCIRNILNPMTKGEPFSSSAGGNLKKLAIYNLILGILYNIMMPAQDLLMVHAFDLPGLLISEKITHITVSPDFDLTFLIYSGILLLLSYVFRYGQELQQLSDETL